VQQICIIAAANLVLQAELKQDTLHAADIAAAAVTNAATAAAAAAGV
jgi:hypothetical protein